MTRTVEGPPLSSLPSDNNRSSQYQAGTPLRNRCSSSGFTVMEMVFVAAIVLVIGTMAIPSITAAQRGFELSSAGYTISGKLDETRTNALKRNQQTWLLLDPTGPSMQIQYSTGVATVNVGAPTFLSKNLIFVGVTSPVQVVFDALGRPVSPPQTILLQNIVSLQGRTITVTSTGRITVQ